MEYNKQGIRIIILYMCNCIIIRNVIVCFTIQIGQFEGKQLLTQPETSLEVPALMVKCVV